MQEKLVIFLHAHDLLRPGWAVLDGNLHVSKIILHGDVAELPGEAKDRIVLVIVPSEDALLTTVTLPKMNRSRLLQAIPYALEEQIIEDVDTMHFAVGEYRANEPLPVVVVARSKMKEWMELLQSWQIIPDSMIPSVFALPEVASAWTVQVNDVAVVRTGPVTGFACDRDNLAELLMLALSAAVTPPEEIAISNSHPESLKLSLPVPLSEASVNPEQLLETMAVQMSKPAPVSLLQGDFQNKKTRRMPKLTNVLRVSAYLFSAWLVLLFLYPVVSFAILDKRAADIKQQIAVIYKRQFPEATSVVTPKERMQQKLNKLTSDFGENHLLLMMANIGKGLSKAPGVQLKRMDFQSNVMTLEITAVSSDIFSAFTDALTQQGLRVKQQNANLNGAHVSATLQVE